MKGLERAERLYHERGFRAKELKGEGKKIIGYVCAFPPVELITAAGLVPYRIREAWNLSPRQTPIWRH
jgi:benzoyl-CoA reductase subunit C